MCCPRGAFSVLVLCMVATGQADIRRWDNGQLIHGTAGITPGPGVQLDHHELAFAELSGLNLSNSRLEFSNLSHARLNHSNLTNANLKGANLTNADFSSVAFANADLTAAVVLGADFSFNTNGGVKGISKEQIYSTQSYQDKYLAQVIFFASDLNGWDFSGQDLTDAIFNQSIISNVSFMGAVVNDAYFESNDLKPEQLYSTQSYHDKNLSRMGFYDVNANGWDLSGQDLTDASLVHMRDFSTVDLTDAIIVGANFLLSELTREQLYSTRSYRDKYLSAITISDSALDGWDFSGQNLTNAAFHRVELSSANLAGANLKNATLVDSTGLNSTNFSSATVYNQWTAFPLGFDPVAAGLSLSITSPGDLDASDVLDVDDVDALGAKIRGGFPVAYWRPVAAFDLNGDGSLSSEDLRTWVQDIKHTWFGDANLDGQFDSTDLTQVFEHAEYEDGLRWNSAWERGDWNGDAEFTTSDLIVAFQDGGYEQGPRVAGAAVPEPSSLVFLLVATLGLIGGSRRAGSTK